MVDELASSGEVLCMEFRGDAMRQGEMLAHWQDAAWKSSPKSKNPENFGSRKCIFLLVLHEKNQIFKSSWGTPHDRPRARY